MTRRRSARAGWISALVAVVLAAMPPGVALAHGDEHEEPTPTMEPTPHEERERGDRAGQMRMRTHLELRVPEEATLGETVRLEAVLMVDAEGGERPLAGAVVIFEAPVVWGELSDAMPLGTAVTDRTGTATIEIEARASGELEIIARFDGDGATRPATSEQMFAIEGEGPLASTRVGLRIPWLNLWLLVAVIALVWGLYLVAGSRIAAIARNSEPAAAGAGASGATTRRQFLRRLLPIGGEAGIAALGGSLVALVVRSPRTHGNLLAPPATESYARTPVAFVGGHAEMREIPDPMDREVSFSREVLPIFLAHGGPHVVRPESSPPPGGVRLDTYDGIMAKEGVVVAGHPEESELVEHLLSPAMQMPPSLPPLPEEQIRVIVTWIAQGARDN